MIFFGTRAPHLDSYELSEACPGCRSKGTLEASVFGLYVHLYWIPTVPAGKHVVLNCTRCNQTWQHNEVPESLRPTAKHLTATTPRPFWHWAGTVLLAALLAWGLWQNKQDRRNDTVYLKAPLAGDIYTVKMTPDSADTKPKYSLLKVRSVGGNVVELLPNQYKTITKNPIKYLNEPEKYDTTAFSLTQLDLLMMYQKGTLLEVKRP